MTTLIVRLMDGDPGAVAHGRMLGWQQAEGVLRGDGVVRVAAPVGIPIEAAGVPGYVSVHWVDVNVEVRIQMTLAPARVGEVVYVTPEVRIGPPAGGLPPITTRGPVAVRVRVGAMGMAGQP
jgi:hypothetical protein